MYTVYNLPEVVKAYVVAREVEGDFWFWGTWDDFKEAGDAAWEVGGQIFNREVIANV